VTENIEDLTIEYIEDDVTIVKELDKAILTKGVWATLLYHYQDWNNAKQAYGPNKYSIRRYQKRFGVYQQRAKFNISSKEQAEKIISILQKWTAK